MQLRIPGPTPVPDVVREAGSNQMINHRGAAFHDLLHDVTDRAKHFFQTEGDLLIFAASGTGGLEASIVNCFSPGDTVLSLSCGFFGDRYSDIAAAYGLEVLRLPTEWGKAVDTELVGDVLARNPGVKGLLLTHNETSTGVQNPVEIIATLAREHGALLLVDSVSGLGAAELRVDDWGVDVAVTASQKAWMTPPGLAMLSVGPNAWAAHAEAQLPRYYFDFTAARKYLERWETPNTPAVSLLFQLQAALQLMAEEGREAIFARHEALRDYLRGRLRTLDLDLLANDDCASRTVTSVRMPDAGSVIADLRLRGVELAGGLGPLEGRMLRIGHMGWATLEDMARVADLLAERVKQV